MKFDDQLAAYLYEKKTLRLEGIGTFTLDSKVNVPHQQEKEIYYPIEGLSFHYNPKSDTEEEVIAFLVQKLHKIQPLIKSDLESYLSNIKQFINLGKPYTIEGVGTLSKNNQGTYEFTPGNFLPVKEELNPKRENAEHNYPVRSQSNAGKIFVTILVAIAALAALGGIGWGVSNLLGKRHASNETEQQQGFSDTISQTATDTAANPVSGAASNHAEVVPATQLPVSTRTSRDSVPFKMIFEITTSKERAHRRTMQLRSYGTVNKYDTVHDNEIVKYRLFVPMKIRQSDTTHIKDSLSTFLGSRIHVEKQ